MAKRRSKKAIKETVTLVCVTTGKEKEFSASQAATILSFKRQGGFRIKEEDGVNENLRVAREQANAQSDNDCGCS